MARELEMPGTPPAWMNRLVALMLRTPLVQRVVGKTFALLTVTGAKTGRRYTTPVQYLTHDGEFVVLSQRMRTWWKNLRSRPEVGMRVEGVEVPCLARLASDDEAHSVLADCLDRNPRVARFYGLQFDEGGLVQDEDVWRLLERVMVIVLTPQPIEVSLEPADVVMQGF